MTGLFLKIKEINKIKFNYQSLMEIQTKIITLYPKLIKITIMLKLKEHLTLIDSDLKRDLLLQKI